MSVVSGIVGAVMGSNVQEDATKHNTQDAENTLQLQEKLHNEDVAREKPFYDQGVEANANLNKMVNGGYSVQESPAAKYQLTQGTKSLNRQLAARGLLGSGNASQRLAELSTGVAANDYNQQYSRLLDQVKIGTGASASTGASSQTFGQQAGQASVAIQANNTNAGNARASLYSGMGGASAGAANTAINAYRSGLFGGGGSAAGVGAGSGATVSYGDAAGNSYVGYAEEAL